jgi:IS5 family transposase
MVVATQPCLSNKGVRDMLRDQYEVDKFFIEIAQRTTEMDGILVQIDLILEDIELFQQVKGDLSQRYAQTTKTGRSSTPVEVIVRMLAVKHLYNLSYEQTEHQVRDSLVLRQFCRVYFEQVPDDTTLLRWANQLQPETLVAFNERLAQLAKQLRVTQGRKLRTDGTVVETNVAYPSDSKLLADGVRVLGRTLKRIRTALGPHANEAVTLFRNRTHTARQVARTIQQAARRRSKAVMADMQQSYQRLLSTAQATVTQVKQHLAHVQTEGGQSLQREYQTLATFLPRVEQVIQQTRRRVFDQESVPASEKIVSLFEPHTCIIRRQKAGKETEFGRKVWLDEVEGGIVTHWSILDGNPPDERQWQPALDRHRRLFGKPPHQASADRGLYSPSNEAYAQAQGVQRIILPKPGHKSDARRQHEAQPWFRRGRRFHIGVEGRISVLKRKHGLDRCRNHGEKGFQRWVGWGVIANNLTQIGRKIANTSQ